MTSGTTATKTGKRARTAPAPTVHVRPMEWTSRRGLTAAMYYADCARCEQRRAFTRLGERLCPCGARLRLVVVSPAGTAA